ncbi:MAG: thiolase family protein, partial [Alphaproteobacteria bacterium]
AGAAGGFLGLVEAVRQLTGRPLGRAAATATTALVSGYGMVDYDRGLCTAAAILERVGAEED